MSSTPALGQDPTPPVDPGRSDPLVVLAEDLNNPGGAFEAVDWLGNEIEVAQRINGVPSAALNVRLDQGFNVNIGDAANPLHKDVAELLPDNRRLIVRTARANPDQDIVLFDGFVDKVQRSANPNQGLTARVSCVHLVDVLRTDLARFVDGQLWLNKGERERFLAAPTQADAYKPIVNHSSDVIFNQGGAKNCLKPLVKFIDPAVSSGPNEVFAPMFTHPREPDGAEGARVQRWTWARVFLYLLYSGRKNPDGTLGDFTEYQFVDRNLGALIYAGDYHTFDPDANPAPQSTPWARALLSKPDSHAIQGMSWLDALNWTCIRSGVGYTVETFWDADAEEHRHGLRFFVPGGSGQRRVTVKMPSVLFETHAMPFEQVARQSEVAALAITTDYSQVVNEAALIGAPWKYEITVELLPLWPLDTKWDVDPGDPEAVEAAVNAMEGDEFAKRYNTSGESHLTAGGKYRKVGRLWGLNEFGDVTDRGRPWAPWNEAAYELHDFNEQRWHELWDGLPGPVFEPDKHVVRARRFQRCVSGHTEKSQIQPLIEVSYDFGNTWSGMLNAGVKILPGRLGVFFSADDLRADGLADKRSGGVGRKFAEAYIRSELRVRVTGGVRGDLVVEINRQTSGPLTRSKRRRGGLLRRGKEARVELRDDRSGPSLYAGNSQFNVPLNPTPTPWPKAERYDATGELEKVLNFIERSDRVRHSGTIVLPGLRFFRDRAGVSGYRPGDELEGVQAEPEQPLHSFRLMARNAEDFPLIESVTWSYKLGDGRQRGPDASTKLQLEDPFATTAFGRTRKS